MKNKSEWEVWQWRQGSSMVHIEWKPRKPSPADVEHLIAHLQLLRKRFPSSVDIEEVEG